MARFEKLFPLKALSSLWRILSESLGSQLPSLQSKLSDGQPTRLTFRNCSLVHNTKELCKRKLFFDLEGALLISPSLFPYFMLVAFEAGGLLRALILLLLYPLFCSVGQELRIKIMVFISFFGIRKDKFRVGTAVLPKFFLENVGCEGFDAVINCGRKVGVSELPTIMVEGFLKDYLGAEAVVGRELKVVYGYYVGLMEEKATGWAILNKLLVESKKTGYQAIGIGRFSKSLLQQLLLHCEEVHLITKAEKRNWQIIPRERYPKPLIFHDGRLAFRPTPFATLTMFMWLPFGFFLSIIRIVVGKILPHWASSPILALTGAIIIVSEPKTSFTSTKNKEAPRGALHVCNHRTLLDPVCISIAIRKPVSAVTYSMSRFNEVISPIKTVQLTRDRETDRKLMENLLNQGDMVVCPEGTTCRENYLLRFSPLFAEITDDIVPVALNVQISMFYGSTASGLKCLDPVFFLLNPRPAYYVTILEKLPGSHNCNIGGKSKFEVANYVQNEIAKALGFERTNFTRKDKYMFLAGNDGIIHENRTGSL